MQFKDFNFISSYQKAKILEIKIMLEKVIIYTLIEIKKILRKKLIVNSYHDYGIKNNNLKTYNLVARCKNNFLELVYSKKYKFLGTA